MAETKNTVRIHGATDSEKLKAATARFMKKAMQAKREKGVNNYVEKVEKFEERHKNSDLQRGCISRAACVPHFGGGN